MLKYKEKSRRMKVAFDYKDNISDLSISSFSIMEKVSRRTSRKQEKNKGQQEFRERWVLNRELGTTVSGNLACAL